MENRSFYNEILTEHNIHPEFKHDLPDANIELEGVNPSCGDDITLKLKVDGGASRDQFLMQFQADILNKTVLRPAIRETTALGAAYLAGLATGVWKDRDEIRSLWHCNMTFAPQMDEAERTRLLAGWHKAVGRSSDWAEH